MGGILKAAIACLTMIVVGATLAFITIEWLAGCGGTTHHADGTHIENECVFLDTDHNTDLKN